MLQRDSLIFIDSASIQTSSELNRVLSPMIDKKICLANRDIFDAIDKEKVLSELCKSDVIHCGLKSEGAVAFTDLQALTFNWNFLVPGLNKDAYTWRATVDFICFDSGLVQKMNGFVSELSVNAAIMEFCYRSMMAGASVKYVASLIKQNLSFKISISKSDVLYFAKWHLGNKHYKFLYIYYLFFRFSAPKIVVSAPRSSEESSPYQFKIKETDKIKTVGPYTAIIPTIDRYDYIDRSIQSLLKYPLPPSEIIVVDQSSKLSRRHDIYEPYIKQGILRVFYLDSPGQCTSRNLAIKEAFNEWLLFFEDDTEAWPEMMKEHIELIEFSQADVSTGVSLAPWKDLSYIPNKLKKYHISDVLATGNCFMSKQSALSVDGLHLAFNRGSGADDDFGKRLFLNGKLIVFNYKAIQTHHKAPKGGMRVHGAWWRHKTTLLGPFPPPTQLYAIMKYYPKKFWFFLISIWLLKAKEKHNFFEYSLLLLLFPFKLFASFRKASNLSSKK